MQLTAAEALATILDACDYTAGNCGVTEMVGAVLPTELIQLARQALAAGFLDAATDSQKKEG
jgi:hypothetical protein